MKNLKVSQCSTGKYNMLSNEESLSFYMGILEDGEIIKEGENKASIHYSGDADELYYFERAVDDNDIQFLFDKCFSYSNRVWGTNDYGGNCLLFAKIYSENFDEISENKAKVERERIENKIKRLQEGLNCSLGIDDYRDEIKNRIEEEINKYNGWIEDNEKEISQYKEGADKIKELRERIDKYKRELIKIKKVNNWEINYGSCVCCWYCD